MPHLIDPGAPPGFGKGAIEDPPDPRDFKLADELAAVELAAAFPTSFIISNPPPHTNQGNTPQCVVYCEGMAKAWEDHKDLLKWFDFDQARQFVAIGGTSSGASPKAGLERERVAGYPEQGGANTALHKITAYYTVNVKSADELKAALMAFGPVSILFHWPASWERLSAAGVVPYPSGVENGHLILCIGWRYSNGQLQFRFRQSWGTLWGPLGGDCYIPFSYIVAKGVTGYKTVDKIEVPTSTAVTYLGHYVIIEGPGSRTLNLYSISSSCGLTKVAKTFAGVSSAPVARGACGGRTYWRTTAGPLTGLSYVCGLTTYGWHIVRRYRRPDGSVYDTRIACTAT